jgi:hypothetical protein
MTKSEPAIRTLFLNSVYYMVIYDFNINRTTAKELYP